MIPVAILDDGVYNYEKLLTVPIMPYRVKNNKIVNINYKNNRVKSRITHGTLCAYILQEMYQDVSIIDIQVLNKYGVGNIEYLLMALEWCVRHGIKLIHMSLCTCNYHDYCKLLPVIDQLIKKQCFLVAAMDNRNIISFPASMQGVFGVFQDCSGRLKSGEFSFVKYDKFNSKNYLATHFEGSVAWNGITKNLNQTNSFAAPVITAHIARIINDFDDIDTKEIIEELYNHPYYVDCKRYNLELEEKLEGGYSTVPVIYIYSCDKEFVYDFLLILKQRGYQCEFFSDLIFDESVIPIELYCREFNLLDAKILAVLEKIYKPDLIIMYHNNNKCKQQTLNDAADLVVWKEYPYIMVKDSNGAKVYESKEDLCNALPHYFD